MSDTERAITRENESAIPQEAQVEMTKLLARFDLEKHRHRPHFDDDPVGTETL
jgi:hypothetical protein